MMKSGKTARGVAGILLCGLGVWLALPHPYREKTYLINTGTCSVETTIVGKQEDGSQGTVVLFHGISANKKIMFYLAQGFAAQNLRIFVPDFPGHGRSAGPFSPERAEECGEALLRKLLASGMASPNRTIVAGHSMGGAIALRVAARVPVAGAVAISPAPMRSTHGVSPEMLLFQDPGPMPKHFLVINGALEPESMRGNAKDLLSSRGNDTASYIEIPGQTHVSLIFSARALQAAQAWASKTLQLSAAGGMPSLRQLWGSVAGFLGLLLLAKPFLREATGQEKDEEPAEMGNPVAWWPMLAEFVLGAIVVVILLRYWNPLRAIRMFQGDYLASFLLLLGAMLLLLHWRALWGLLTQEPRGLVGAVVGALVLLALFTAWFELSLYEAWLTLAKWARFPFLFAALLPYHLAEEVFLGPMAERSGWRRLGAGVLLRLVTLMVLAFGVFYLDSGEILLVLLAPYFVLMYVLMRRGIDIVREATGSAAAAAVFGAILFAGFCLVIFPVT
jgi:pimeloyl-ACP methyl ester carboxylesterase